MDDLISRSALTDAIVDLLVFEWGYEGIEASVKRIFSEIPTVDAVEVDDNLGEMLNWAVRYALGRMTYAVNDTVNYVLPLIPKLDRRTLSVMQRDIKTAPEYGHDCDEADWMRLLHAIREELKRRADDAV